MSNKTECAYARTTSGPWLMLGRMTLGGQEAKTKEQVQYVNTFLRSHYLWSKNASQAYPTCKHIYTYPTHIAHMQVCGYAHNFATHTL